MGIFGNLLRGKPAFEAPSEANNSSQQNSGESSQEPRSGQKVIPRIDITRVELPRNESSRMQVVVAIRNNSQGNIDLEDIEALGNSRNLNDQLLRAGEEREFTIYDSSRPNSRHSNARIKFKDETGDYFTAHFTVEFEQESDNTYSPLRFKLNGPVQDT